MATYARKVMMPCNVAFTYLLEKSQLGVVASDSETAAMFHFKGHERPHLVCRTIR